VSLSVTSSSNPYTVSFLDVHDNVDHHAIVLGGYHLEGGDELSFTVGVIDTSTTRYYLAVALLGTTSCVRLQFSLLLIGTEAAGFIEAISLSTL
jgi:hypothetical protein